MATSIRMEVLMPKSLALDPKRLARVVENTLNDAALAVKVDFDVTTRTWNTRPTFLIRRTEAQREIFTTSLIYLFVSGGTKPHPIRPRFAKALRFYRTGFSPKSTVRWIGSGQGSVANQDLTFRQLVHHPGNKAREYEIVIKEKWDERLPVTLQRAIDAEVA